LNFQDLAARSGVTRSIASSSENGAATIEAYINYINVGSLQWCGAEQDGRGDRRKQNIEPPDREPGLVCG
jgi:hypothetical protein